MRQADGTVICPYLVGDIYITTNSTNPSTIWSGTTWELIKDRFLLGSGDTYTLGSTGGEATHTLTVDEMPSHQHLQNAAAATSSPSGGSGRIDPWVQGERFGTAKVSATGGNQAHNNMPPYRVVNQWLRTK